MADPLATEFLQGQVWVKNNGAQHVEFLYSITGHKEPLWCVCIDSNQDMGLVWYTEAYLLHNLRNFHLEQPDAETKD